MAITREELKKLVLQEMQQNQVDEGVGDWLRSKASSMLTKTGQKMTQAGEKVAPPPQLDDKTLRKVGDFLQMAQRDPELTKLILQTPFGKTVFGSDEKEKVTEALGQDFIKMIKDKKVTPQEMDDFIAAMSKNPAAKKMLDGLKLTKPDIQTDKQPEQAAAQQDQKPAAAGTPQAATPSAQDNQQAGTEKPQVFNVEKGKNSLQQQLLQKYGNQLGSEANKFISSIARDIKADLAASGVKVQESIEQIADNILNEVLNGNKNHILSEQEQQDPEVMKRANVVKKEKELPLQRQQYADEMKKANAELKKAEKLVASAAFPAERNERQKTVDDLNKKIEDLKAKSKSAGAEIKQMAATREKEQSLTAKKLARDEPKLKMQNMLKGREQDKQKADLMKKALQTKRVSKPGIVDVNQAVYSKLSAFKKLNPKMAKNVDTLIPQIMTAVTKYVNYAVNKSGKTGEVKVASKSTKPTAPQQTAKPAAGAQLSQKTEPTLKEALVEEIYNLLTGKNK